MKFNIRFLKAMVCSLILAAALHTPPAAAGPAPSPQLPGTRDSEAATRAWFTDLKVVTHEGQEVRFYSDVLKDKVVLVNFFYTECKTVAALQSKVISDLQGLLGDRLGRDIFLVSITVDPARDTPEKVRGYARTFAARKGWSLLTGKKENVDWINYKLGNYTENPEDHAALFLLGNLKTGQWLKVAPDTRAKTLAEHLIKLAEGREGSR